jgi:hypothetical protein
MGHASVSFWLQAGAWHARTFWASESKENAEREDREGRVAASGWLSEFLSHFIFKLNYFIAN